MDSQVIENPLNDWEDFENYEPPDPIKEGDGFADPPDWKKRKKESRKTKNKGGLATGSLPHGFMFQRVHYLRGYENFMRDVARGKQNLDELIDKIREYNLERIRKYLNLGVEFMFFAGDLGTQDRLAISPDKFRHYFLPCYKDMFELCKNEGVIVYLHSDGHILEMIPDFVEAGLDIINPQVRANGLESLEKIAKGNICIDLDLDRQLFPYASSNEIKEHIQKSVDTLNTKKGGLMLNAEISPDIPLENIKTIIKTLESIGGPKPLL
ncbi:hypothetical protein AKJ65_03360 [candidate division MSBL1 archaeon SCGC-AAA259E19]|uniref:Uroporphyrinogen decarboxylase (URO-D) domain-containing protein n=1 Tax=candidate division MSBL1 archaeon SCGC-AAA259E19 TaxID=1698264 RepID=A0A133UKU9_9EURY|nr:hypothetical protein AKJ65_03360 [candidate division MSBL1 archaeon SCGC-AAA259E19]